MSTAINPKLKLVGPVDNNRIEYRVQGKKVTVGSYDKDKFESTMNDYLNSKDKYNSFKANNPIANGLIGLLNLGIIGGGTYGAVKLSNYFCKNVSKILKLFSAIGSGFAAFCLGGLLTRFTDTPGRTKMKDAEKKLNTLDVCFEK